MSSAPRLFRSSSLSSMTQPPLVPHRRPSIPPNLPLTQSDAAAPSRSEGAQVLPSALRSPLGLTEAGAWEVVSVHSVASPFHSPARPRQPRASRAATGGLSPEVAPLPLPVERSPLLADSLAVAPSDTAPVVDPDDGGDGCLQCRGRRPSEILAAQERRPSGIALTIGESLLRERLAVGDVDAAAGARVPERTAKRPWSRETRLISTLEVASRVASASRPLSAAVAGPLLPGERPRSAAGREIPGALLDRMEILSAASRPARTGKLEATVQRINQFISSLQPGGSPATAAAATSYAASAEMSPVMVSPLRAPGSQSTPFFTVDELEEDIGFNVAVVLVDGDNLMESVLGPEGFERYERLATLICDKIQTLLVKLGAAMNRRQRNTAQSRAHVRAAFSLRSELVATIIQDVTRDCIQKPGFFSDRTIKLVLLDRCVEIGASVVTSITMGVAARFVPESVAAEINGVFGTMGVLAINALAALASAFFVHYYKAHRHEKDLLEDLKRATERELAPEGPAREGAVEGEAAV